jgi:hypothetical protein
VNGLPHLGRPLRRLPWYVVALSVAAADYLALFPGWWAVTLAIAVGVSVTVRGRAAFGAVLIGSVAGWTAMLATQGLGRLGRTADLVGALATGQPGQSWLTFTLTYATVLGLALAGTWFGAAIRRLFSAAPAVAPLADVPAADPMPVPAHLREIPARMPAPVDQSAS